MIRGICVVLASSSMLALSAAAAAQSADPAAAAQEANDGVDRTDGDIIVTARRRDESLRDVPQTITAVTAEEFEKLNILDLADITKVVSGVQIEGTNVSMRGVTFNPNSAAAVPTTATYLNDVPVLPAELFQANFDVGQVEILRGPQGTRRGISSPSGAITFTTKRPDLTEVGGYLSGTATNRDQHNLQAAVNLPVVPGVLAMRVAGLFDDNEGNGIRSVNNSAQPYDRTRAVRVSARLEPTSSLRANVVYQYLYNKSLSFGGAVFGNGSPGGVNPNAPAGYNGPVLTPFDRRAVVAYAAVGEQRVHLLTAQVDWEFAGQQLSYVGSYQKYSTRPTSSIGDPGNILQGFPLNGTLFRSDDTVKTHEVRLSSRDRIGGFLDYVVGAFWLNDDVDTRGSQGIVAFGDGSFGAPGSIANPGSPPNFRYAIETLLSTPRSISEFSLFGTATAHIGDNLEIEAGVRRINSRIDSDLTASLAPFFSAVSLPAGTCAFIGGQFGATYPGICDVPVPGSVVLTSGQHVRSKPWIYHASIKYQVTPDLMVYGLTGSSWREGIVGIGISNPTNNAQLNQYLFLRPETSKSYEAGFKWSFFDRRALLNVSYYHQTYDGYIYGVPGSINYLNGTAVSANPFFANVPAKVDGVDVELSGRITDRWSASLNFSYANGRINSKVPCNDGNFDGVPDGITPTVAGFTNAGVAVATCQVSTGSSSAPKWNLRVQSEYKAALSDRVEGFITGLLAYQPRNPNASQTYVVPAYALLDLFIGVRDPSRRWEVALFGKNITNTTKILNQDPGQIQPPGRTALFGPTGYTNVTLTAPREFGINLRYAFGSR